MRRVSQFCRGFAFAGMIFVPQASYADGLAYEARPCCAQPFGWTGFYVGANGGYGWSPHNNQLRDLPNGPGNLFFGLSPQGGFGGGQIGYNWQGGPLVIGIEADIQGSDIRDRFRWSLARSEADVDWFGTVRGRLGYAAGPALIYATGGFAYGHVENSEIGGVKYIADDTATGYTVGAGVEFKIASAWSLKTEYQFFNLGRNDPVTSTGVRLSSFPGVTVRDDEFHSIRIGLNYRFGDRDVYPVPYPPLK
jgi:outer membrane immunogenic protein